MCACVGVCVCPLSSPNIVRQGTAGITIYFHHRTYIYSHLPVGPRDTVIGAGRVYQPETVSSTLVVTAVRTSRRRDIIIIVIRKSLDHHHPVHCCTLYARTTSVRVRYQAQRADSIAEIAFTIIL